uniref:Uncharacterized protein n=1 Tax=Strongyloides stercoralis TaxID=6248 RepID=A0AAF5DLX7_STRER
GCLPKNEFVQFLPIVYLIYKAIRKPKFQLKFSKKFGSSQSERGNEEKVGVEEREQEKEGVRRGKEGKRKGERKKKKGEKEKGKRGARKRRRKKETRRRRGKKKHKKAQKRRGKGKKHVNEERKNPKGLLDPDFYLY